MDTAQFIDRLNTLDASEITAVAAHLRLELDTPGGEVGWWQAWIAVDAVLRRHRLSRVASVLAHQAAQAVLRSARNVGADDACRDEVTAVARAASEAVRAMVAERGGVLRPNTLVPLYAPWQRSAVAA